MFDLRSRAGSHRATRGCIFIAEILGHNLLQGQPLSPSPKATKIFTSKVSCFLTGNLFAGKKQLMHQPQRVNSRNGIKLPSA
jgi:hypothetical protein